MYLPKQHKIGCDGVEEKIKHPIVAVLRYLWLEWSKGKESLQPLKQACSNQKSIIIILCVSRTFSPVKKKSFPTVSYAEKCETGITFENKNIVELFSGSHSDCSIFMTKMLTNYFLSPR